MKRDEAWKKIRPKVDEAIRAGLSQREFLELHDINKNTWYYVKPKEFSWKKIQDKLGIEKTKPGPKPGTVQNKKIEKVISRSDDRHIKKIYGTLVEALATNLAKSMQENSNMSEIYLKHLNSIGNLMKELN